MDARHSGRKNPRHLGYSYSLCRATHAMWEILALSSSHYNPPSQLFFRFGDGEVSPTCDWPATSESRRHDGKHSSPLTCGGSQLPFRDAPSLPPHVRGRVLAVRAYLLATLRSLSGLVNVYSSNETATAMKRKFFDTSLPALQAIRNHPNILLSSFALGMRLLAEIRRAKSDAMNHPNCQRRHLQEPYRSEP